LESGAIARAVVSGEVPSVSQPDSATADAIAADANSARTKFRLNAGLPRAVDDTVPSRIVILKMWSKQGEVFHPVV
jgi:hypothetical protein